MIFIKIGCKPFPRLTPGNVDDRKNVPAMASGISGKMFGDKGYISKELFNQLALPLIWGKWGKM